MSEPRSYGREDLRDIAKYQKGLLVAILLYLAAYIVAAVVPQEIKLFVLLGAVILSLVGTVFVFLLATKVYSTGTGIFLGILVLIPLIGLITLLVINSKATNILKQHGIGVGLLGARDADIR
jgi:hypothetical protein